MSLLYKSASLLVALSMASSSFASPTWYERHSEGWHWYNDPEKFEEPIPKEIQPEPKETPPKEPPQPKKMVPPPESPKPPVAFSSEWLNVMIPKYLSNAVDDPTPENVEAFYLLQRLAMDKAERFQKVAEQVRVGNKFIDETERRPISNFGLQTVDRQAEERRRALLEKISKSAGLFFFFRADCPYCEKQAPLVKHISETNGFDVLAVSIGGGSLKTTAFENTVIDSGQAQMLSVESTPSLFLVHPESATFALIGSSLLTVPEIQERIVLIAQRNKWITEEEVNATRPRLLNASGVDLSKELPKMLKAVQEDPNKLSDLIAMLDGRDPVGERERLSKLPEDRKRALMDKDGFIEPANILAIIKSTDPSRDQTTDSEPHQPAGPAFPQTFDPQ